ncbi:TIGR00730 family Rossman fold protein [Nocardioides guangzhouensis]|uniref:Cytokinin riboside 5'-monophosphate phosphoribohydrolase n=1 Tax=Nocardioides guangzhouensis TaxID=2497878 RepID=A0A4Q4Z699_9ACTN|nr:TIGR00730 family Rossman fold protein [Nocardioides guangzhouensis]RYP82566.1 TIGR00730 family Rossman fold protein [Nocardioides guangzhouensis]
MRIAVFTGSAAGAAEHREHAATFGRELAEAGVGIVYGGAHVGLMGVVADAALAAGGEVIGVMPQHLVDREVAHDGLTRLEIVEDMHTRKARMAELADGFVALPGGIGTLEELFEVFTWAQLGLHAKPTALVDPHGFYRPLLTQLGDMVAHGYLGQDRLDALGVVDAAATLLAYVEEHQPPEARWSRSRG